MNAPLRFRPYLRPMVWGGRRLSEALRKPLPTDEKYGESWEISDHASHHSVVSEGPFAGETLATLMQRRRAELLGAAAEQYTTFPWLVKYLDAWDWLSVQVHPDEDAVKTWWPGEGSKTEAWFVLDASPDSKIYAGLRPGVDEASVAAAIAAGTVADCLHSLTPRPGDCLFLPAGTVHAVGGGVLMAEVQQTSDATFRLFDWDRRDAQGKSRPLHVREALACIHWRNGPVQPVHAAGYPGAAPVQELLVSCRYFTLEYVCQAAPFSCAGTGRLQVLLVLHGRGSLATAGGAVALETGDTLLLPASLGALECRPDGPLGLLLSTLP
jgi:mannose-6-phosphate isomerase